MSDNDNKNQSSEADTRSPEDIERDLARTREELGETLEALGAKLDVKSRTKDWTRDTAGRSQQQAKVLVDEHGRELAIAGGVIALVVVLLFVRRARKR